jgi:hypothetical protein
MSVQGGLYDKALARATEHARAWLDSAGERPVGPRVGADELLAGFGGPLQNDAMAPEDVVDLLATLADHGLMAIASGRFFAFPSATGPPTTTMFAAPSTRSDARSPRRRC